MELIPGIEPGASALPSIEFYQNKTRTQSTGNPDISCVIFFQNISIVVNFQKSDNS